MVFNKSKNFYDVLGVNYEADFNEIRSAYRSLARKYHPDVNKTPDAEEIFKEITNAYNTLSNPQERNRYNILKGIFKQETKNPKNFEEEKQKEEKTPSPKKENYTQENTIKRKNTRKSRNFNLLKTIQSKILSLKRLHRAKNSNKPQKGENITTDIQISQEEVITGSKRIINIRTTKTCPQCLGHKFVNSGKCPKCDGKGEITETKKITVSIPKGIKNGAKLRLKGEGATGKNGGQNGDLYINISVKSQSNISYDKLNVYYNISVSPYEAALGEELSITTVDNEKIKFKLPPKTSSGQKFRIANQGLKKGSRTGDLIIIVSIEFSKDLSDDEIKLYKELKNLSKDNTMKDSEYGSKN